MRAYVCARERKCEHIKMYRSICILVKRLELFLRVGIRRYTSDLYFILFFTLISLYNLYIYSDKFIFVLKYTYVCSSV